MNKFRVKQLLFAFVFLLLLVQNVVLIRLKRDAEDEVARLRARLAELEAPALPTKAE